MAGADQRDVVAQGVARDALHDDARARVVHGEDGGHAQAGGGAALQRARLLREAPRRQPRVEVRVPVAL